MTLHLLKKVMLGVAMLLCDITISNAQNTEEDLNVKYYQGAIDNVSYNANWKLKNYNVDQ